jgi:Putative inner membrane protein (DUF1819)
MPLESKRIAALLLTKPDEASWKRAIVADNLLQKRTIDTAVRQSTLIRRRLAMLDDFAWRLITERESEITNQLLFAAAIKQNKLLGDFMRNVYAIRQRRMEPDITAANWEDFLTECAHHDASIASWNDNTKLKIFNGIARILIEAKYLVDRKSMKLSPRDLHPLVRAYLLERNEFFVLDCLERTK